MFVSFLSEKTNLTYPIFRFEPSSIWPDSFCDLYVSGEKKSHAVAAGRSVGTDNPIKGIIMDTFLNRNTNNSEKVSKTKSSLNEVSLS